MHANFYVKVTLHFETSGFDCHQQKASDHVPNLSLWLLQLRIWLVLKKHIKRSVLILWVQIEHLVENSVADVDRMRHVGAEEKVIFCWT